MSQCFTLGSHRHWCFNFSISPSNEHSGLISFSIDWFDLLSDQRTLKSLLQPHSSKTLILQCSAFFMVRMGIKPVTLALLAPCSELTGQDFVSITVKKNRLWRITPEEYVYEAFTTCLVYQSHWVQNNQRGHFCAEIVSLLLLEVWGIWTLMCLEKVQDRVKKPGF